MISNNRINYLDYAKAIVIMVVITVHIGFYQLNSNILFAMPLFFVVTGYSFTLGKRTIKESVFLRFKTVMIPFWIFMLLYTAVEVVRAYVFRYGNYGIAFASLANTVYGSGMIPFENGIASYLKEIMSYKAQPIHGVDVILPANCHLWFLPAAFTGYVMFVSLVERTNKNNWIKVICIAGLLAIASIEVVFPTVCQLPYGIGRGGIAAAFMLVGYWLKDKKILERKTVKFNVLVCIVAVALYIGALCLGSDGSSMVRSYYGPYGAASVCITFVGGTCGAVLLLQMCRLLDKLPYKRIKKFLSFMGKNVMVFYVLHMFVKFIFDAIYIYLLHSGRDILLDEYKMALLPETSAVYMIFEIVAIIAVCFTVAKLRQYTKISAKKE